MGQYHNRKLFKADYAPKKFCYAIRRPDHYPEGILSIEGKIQGSTSQPISSIVNRLETVTPMKFSINAATTITFGGERYVHAWMAHTFSGVSGIELTLGARARQFSCFIMMIGTVVSADQFEPKHAIIIKNKDDLLIPLLLEQIPTAQMFRDTIDSLSEEQQRFARSFRSMQLASTLFGVCIIQIKPQLEKLLNIPNDSLTKEIQLTQDLLELFIDYQIPSDLLSFDPEDHPNASTVEQINIVKEHVATMRTMIEKSKQRELDEVKLETQFRAPLAPQEDLLCSLSPSLSVKDKKVKKRKMKKKVMKKGGKALEMKSKPKPSAPEPSAPEPAKPVQEAQQEDKQVSNEFEAVSDAEIEGLDVTKLPTLLDEKFEKYDKDNALHSTIIKAETNWNKKFLKALLAKPTETTLSPEDLRKEKNKTFDSLDALTRSGGLEIDEASFHVVLASTHCFDQTLMDTIIKDNINPIEKLERSTLIVASTIQQVPPAQLLTPDHLDRIKQISPAIFE